MYVPINFLNFFSLTFQSDAQEPAELDDIINDDLSTDSDEVTNEPDGGSRIPSVSDVSPLEKSYVVKRMSQSNGTVYYQPACSASKTSGSTHSRLSDHSIGKKNKELLIM